MTEKKKKGRPRLSETEKKLKLLAKLTARIKNHIKKAEILIKKLI